jgi:hypothetical protein
MNDDFLTNLRESPPPEFAASLYQRISKPMIARTNISYGRRLALTITVIAAVSLIALSASPQARALAADFLHRMGIFTFSTRPVGEPVIIASPSSEQLANATATPFLPTSQTGTQLDKAVSEAGFQPYLPTYLPDGYYQDKVVATQYLDDQQVGHGMGIFANYISREGGYLSIHTNRFDGRALDVPTGGLSVTDVIVSGQPGVWIEGMPFHSSYSSSQSFNMLLWQEGDYVLAIQAAQLPLVEVLKIAGSLKQYPARWTEGPSVPSVFSLGRGQVVIHQPS